MALPNRLKRWYTVSETAAALESLFEESVTEQDVLDIISNGDLPVWWDATGRYAVPLYPGCDFHVDRKDYVFCKALDVEPTDEDLAQFYSETKLLVQGSDYAQVLHGMHRLHTGLRSDYIELPAGNDRAHIDFLHGLLALDGDGETILQILRRLDGAPPFSMAIGDFWREGEAPEPTELRVAANDIHELIDTTRAAAESRNPPEAADALHDADRTKLLKQIGGLALLCAEKGGRYTRGQKVNRSQIAEAVVEIVDALPDADRKGLGNSSLRESINAGLNLLGS